MYTSSVKYVIVLINLAGGLAGCTVFSPRYQITHRYEPPTDPAGIVCLEKCTQKLEMCQQSCTSTYQACLTRIEPLAEEKYRKAVERYEDEVDTYRRRMQSRNLGWGRTTLGWGWGGYPWGWGGYPWGWGSPWGWGGGPYYGLGYSYPFFYEPPPPPRPDRRREFDRLRYQQCEVECGCQSVQDSCFLGCGGRKIIEERCIANCPK